MRPQSRDISAPVKLSQTLAVYRYKSFYTHQPIDPSSFRSPGPSCIVYGTSAPNTNLGLGSSRQRSRLVWHQVLIVCSLTILKVLPLTSYIPCSCCRAHSKPKETTTDDNEEEQGGVYTNEAKQGSTSGGNFSKSSRAHSLSVGGACECSCLQDLLPYASVPALVQGLPDVVDIIAQTGDPCRSSFFCAFSHPYPHLHPPP